MKVVERRGPKNKRSPKRRERKHSFGSVLFTLLAAVAGVLAPLFQPLGLGDWRVVTALVTGFLAKESVVATLEVLNVTASLTALTAIPMLAFCLLYTPCVAAIAAVKRELGAKWACWMVLFQCIVAWVIALLAYLAAGLFM